MGKDKLSVCIFCRYFYPSIGGNETQALLLAKELVRQGVKVMVIASRIDHTYSKEEIYQGIKIYRVGDLSELLKGVKRLTNRLKITRHSERVIASVSGRMVGKAYSKSKLSALSDLVNILYFKFNALRKLRSKRKEYNLIHSQMLGQIGYIALRGALNNHKPVLIKDATLGGLDLVDVGFNIKRQRRLLREKANFVAISTQIYDTFISQGIDKNSIFKVPNGIFINDLENKNNFNADPFTLLFIGNFWQGEIKGLDILLRAIGKVVYKFHNVKLSIAGAGNIEYYRNIANEVDVSENVSFLGSVEDTDMLYRCHSIFILPSRIEGMSNATLEAMSYGMPCVVTNVSGSADQIEHGKEGLIVPIGNSDAMADAIIQLLDEPAKARSMGQAAKDKIRKEFDIQLIAKKYIDIYKNIIDRKQ